MKPLLRTLFVLILLPCAPLAAQDKEKAKAASDEVQKMVREGAAEALETKLAGGRTPEEKQLLAQAYGNRARRQKAGDERKRAFEQAADKYRKWLDELERAGKGGGLAATVKLAAGRVEYAGMILSGQAAGDLDEFEITMGQRGDRKALLGWLETARGQYEKAAQEIAPLAESLSRQDEEDLLAAGLLDLLQQTKLDLTLNLGWTSYYLAVLEPKDETKRQQLLTAAERKFGTLIDSGQTGQMRYQCYTALAMVQREQGHYEDAEKSFHYALGEDAEPQVVAQVRYELARCQIKESKFDEARTTLRPLVEKDLQNLSAEDRPARFYINLAQVWDANSYLLEADAIRAEARDSTARTAILQKAQRSREAGHNKMRRLVRLGGPWPGLVQIYVAASVNLKTPMRDLSPMELLYTAGVLSDAKRYKDALERLQEAAGRPDVDQQLAADLLYETGRCQYQLQNLPDAAKAFQKVAAEYRSYEKAAQAATFAYQIWGKIAEGSKRADDYLRLAETLRNLIENYADHPNRNEALWLLPVALQLAGKYDEAASQFAKVPENTKNWEEAQFRRAVCGRRACEAARASLGAEEYKAKGRQAAQALLHYADEAGKRAEQAPNKDAVVKWSAEARVAGAEMLASQGVDDYQPALEAVAAFETQYPKSEQHGRVLAVRIRAYRGLREFDQASKILQQFLQTAPPDQIGGTLAGLAKGMQEEVERLSQAGQKDEARKLALDSLATFEELQKWVAADASRGKHLDPVLFGRAQMHYLAGQCPEAQKLVATLLEKSPENRKNGNYQYLNALVLAAGVTDSSSPADLKRAQDAWAALLTDVAIRQRAPERYWEARYNWLALALRLGQAGDVIKAIKQESVWYPDLGGSPWKEKLEALYTQAGGTESLSAASQATTQATTQPAAESGPAGQP